MSPDSLSDCDNVFRFNAHRAFHCDAASQLSVVSVLVDPMKDNINSLCFDCIGQRNVFDNLFVHGMEQIDGRNIKDLGNSKTQQMSPCNDSDSRKYCSRSHQDDSDMNCAIWI